MREKPIRFIFRARNKTKQGLGYTPQVRRAGTDWSRGMDYLWKGIKKDGRTIRCETKKEAHKVAQLHIKYLLGLHHD